MEQEIAVPAGRAPEASLLAHLLFALKHEGIDLATLADTSFGRHIAL
ncbi:hypothetical protein CZ787_18475 [Halomonas citrativorans]|uniref:Uncharacterized protein n=1 Tax=Halomonas citrativorans TaxID=2742612 RepID=A0A1R4I5L6_9GAMM|nr:hypothetical protein CZ787_18475 [Halomonas citrativorans]